MRGVPELHAVTRTFANGVATLKIGSCVTLSTLQHELETLIALKKKPSDDWPAAVAQTTIPEQAAKPLYDHVGMVAGHQIRGWGSVGGNLMMARNQGFGADVAPLMCGLGATVDVRDASGAERNGVPVETFMQEGDGTRDTEAGVPRALLVSINIPFADGSTFVTHRVAARRRQCHAMTNAAFLVTKGKTVRMFYGALGGAPKRAPTSEQAMQDMLASKDGVGFPELMKAVRTDTAPLIEPGNHHEDIQKRLVQSFALKFFAVCVNNVKDGAPWVAGADTIHSHSARRLQTDQARRPLHTACAVTPPCPCRQRRGLQPPKPESASVPAAPPAVL